MHILCLLDLLLCPMLFHPFNSSEVHFIIVLIAQVRKWNLRLSDLLKVTQIVRDRAGIHT